MTIENMDFTVRFLPFPPTVRGVIEHGEDGIENIYINSTLPVEVQRKSVRHELLHLIRGDLDSPLPDSVLEAAVRADRRTINSVFTADGYPILLNA